MITITSYLHRDRLRDLIRRWMYNDLHATDVEEITRLVYFNNAYISRYLPVFSELVFSRMFEGPFHTFKARVKAHLKDVIVKNTPYRNPRVETMLSAYRREPGDFYRETPFHGTLYFSRAPDAYRYIGASRIKRVRRLAEKSARRIIDWIYANIEQHADRLAQDRARRIGIQLEALVTPPEDMVEEFVKSERRLLQDLKNGRPITGDPPLIINDVAGVKVIVEDRDQDRFLNRMAEAADCELIEVEPHTGRYNAVNLIVKYRPDRESLTTPPLGKALSRLMQARGVSPEQAHRRFRDFVCSGESHVHVEVIVCNYQEMLESEIGRCMHEDRIVRQRLEQQYRGQLARNIEFLTRYLFAFPASAQLELAQLPIQLWNRYLPDYFDEVLQELFHIPAVEVLS